MRISRRWKGWCSGCKLSPIRSFPEDTLFCLPEVAFARGHSSVFQRIMRISRRWKGLCSGCKPSPKSFPEDTLFCLPEDNVPIVRRKKFETKGQLLTSWYLGDAKDGAVGVNHLPNDVFQKMLLPFTRRQCSNYQRTNLDIMRISRSW